MAAGSQLCILVVRTDGIPFMIAPNDVVLSEGIDGVIPPKYFKKVRYTRPSLSVCPSMSLWFVWLAVHSPVASSSCVRVCAVG